MRVKDNDTESEVHDWEEKAETDIGPTDITKSSLKC